MWLTLGVGLNILWAGVLPCVLLKLGPPSRVCNVCSVCKCVQFMHTLIKYGTLLPKYGTLLRVPYFGLQ